MTLPRPLWIVTGAVPVAAIAWFSTEFWPSPIAPAPLAAMVPFFWMYQWLGHPGDAAGPAIAAVACLGYLLASIPAFVSTAAGWVCCALLYLGVLITNTLFLAAYFGYGVRYQGEAYAAIVVALNVLAAVAVGMGLVIARKRSSAHGVILCQVGLFCWLNWVAFPWFGEWL